MLMNKTADSILTIFTPAYNRAHTLPRTYESLCRQSCKDFIWLIVDLRTTQLNWCAIGRAATTDLKFNISIRKMAACTLPTTWPMPISTRS